ncbi:MAG: hypothetical protein R2764_11115 [Bacteroidales bacterium]
MRGHENHFVFTKQAAGEQLLTLFAKDKVRFMRDWKFHPIFSILLIITVTTSISCSKVSDKNMTVIKDCTGSFLRYNGKDYHICNVEMVGDYDSGMEVEASFKKIKECLQGEISICEMYHQNEGWIQVTRIK